MHSIISHMSIAAPGRHCHAHGPQLSLLEQSSDLGLQECDGISKALHPSCQKVQPSTLHGCGRAQPHEMLCALYSSISSFLHGCILSA